MKTMSEVMEKKGRTRVMDLPTSHPLYETWNGMLIRCFSPKEHKRYPSYIGTDVCDKWLVFSKFVEDFEDMKCGFDLPSKWQLDKDILEKGSKYYSRETSCIVSPRLNSFLTHRRELGEYPLGVRLHHTGSYEVRCHNSWTKKRKTLGMTKDVYLAGLLWQHEKHRLACKYASEGLGTDFLDTRVGHALRDWYVLSDSELQLVEEFYESKNRKKAYK